MRRYPIPRETPSAGAQNRRDGWKNLRFSTEITIYLGNGTREAYSYYTTPIGSHRWQIDTCRFRWHWVTLTRFRGHSRSSELTHINLPPITSYENSIAIMGLSHTVSEINEDFCGKSQIWQCACTLHSTMWSVSGGCKIITYLESQTPSFILNVQLSSGYDDN